MRQGDGKGDERGAEKSGRWERGERGDARWGRDIGERERREERKMRERRGGEKQ